MSAYAVEDIRELLNGSDQKLDGWIDWLSKRGVGPKDGRLDELSVIALAAAVRFHSTGKASRKVGTFLESLLASPPEPGTDWVAVDRPGSKSIQIEPGPFKTQLSSRDRMPIVFDPHPLLEQLKTL